MINHRVQADRLLHTAQGMEESPRRAALVAEAHAHATLALAEGSHTLALLRLLDFAGDLPGGRRKVRTVLLALIRRRLEFLPPDARDGAFPNGGT